MALDPVQATLLMLLGASVSYVVDEAFGLTPWLSALVSRLLGQ